MSILLIGKFIFSSSVWLVQLAEKRDSNKVSRIFFCLYIILSDCFLSF